MINNPLYIDDVSYGANLPLPWEKLENKTILISGATGMIGSFLIDVLMQKDIHCTIYAIGRSAEKAKVPFKDYFNSPYFHFIPCDINKELAIEGLGKLDYLFHLASNTHPLAYSTDPIGTIATNIIGTNNLLDFASKHNAIRFIFASSVEIYGENKGDIERFDENYLGYINSNTLRAGYPESKRCGEALCQAYRKAKNIEVSIARIARTYGPTMLESDTKAISQFVKNAIKGEDIVLKSEGRQNYSYTYVSDAVSGLLSIALIGEDGEAYNIADESSDITLRDLAAILANIAKSKVIFELPSDIEKAGYSTATKALLDGTKIKGLGWSPHYSIKSGMERNIEILKSL